MRAAYAVAVAIGSIYWPPAVGVAGGLVTLEQPVAAEMKSSGTDPCLSAGSILSTGGLKPYCGL